MKSSTREITVVTGTRAEYGLLRSSMEAIQDHPELDLSIVATGTHLSTSYGNTIDDIRADGFEIAATPHMLVDGDTGAAMAKSLGVGVLSFVETFQHLGPDVVLVLGDRDEPLAASLAAAHMNLPVAHVHGGDAARGATIDESIRHAITKFSHLHFPATERSAGRIRNLGEEEWRIQVVGAPGIDDILSGHYASPDDIERQIGVDPSETIIVILQHPLTKAPEEAAEQMKETLDAVSHFDAQLVCIYPNSDAGSRSMIDIIESRKDDLGMIAFKNLPRAQFLGLLNVATLLVGNSSAGIIEAPTLSLPVVDVGPRQAGRERADHTMMVPHAAEDIQEGIARALDESFRSTVRSASNPYERGGSGEAIAERLAEIELDDTLLQKRLTY